MTNEQIKEAFLAYDAAITAIANSLQPQIGISALEDIQWYLLEARKQLTASDGEPE